MKKLMYLGVLLCMLFATTAQAQTPPPPTTTTPTETTNRPGATKLTPAEMEAAAAAEAAQLKADLSMQPVATTTPTPVDYNNPKSFFDEGLLGLIEAGIISVIALLGGFIPGLRKVSNAWVRSGVVIFASLAALATFKVGALNEEFFALLGGTFLPNFGGTNLIYATVKNILVPLIKRLSNDATPKE